MDFKKLKEKIGKEVFLKLEKEAEKEVSLALKMDLVDKYRQKKYYRQRFLLTELLGEFELFERLGIKILPIEVVNILFKCKLLFSVSNNDEYIQRVGGNVLFDMYRSIINFQNKSNGLEYIIENSFDLLLDSLKNRTVLSAISELNYDSTNLQTFFNNLFSKLDLPFNAFIDEKQFIKRQKEIDPYFSKKNKRKNAIDFFGIPSVGYSTFGSASYVMFYSIAYLRNFLNMLRIASFSNPAQLDFGQKNVSIMAPIGPVILGDCSKGAYCWNESEKNPWEKIPDGCLFLSFGYRSVAKMYLDERCFGSLERFFIDNKIIFKSLANPWAKQNIINIEPSLDILSSVTQIQDLGAKILLIYCCLEHLFVPGSGKTDNKTYIIGGINAIKPELLSWFDNLYKLRCAYAHKGFISHDKQTINFIFLSVKNVFSLIVAKLSLQK